MVKLTTLLNPKLQTICSRCKLTYRVEYAILKYLTTRLILIRPIGVRIRRSADVRLLEYPVPLTI